MFGSASASSTEKADSSASVTNVGSKSRAGTILAFSIIFKEVPDNVKLVINSSLGLVPVAVMPSISVCNSSMASCTLLLVVFGVEEKVTSAADAVPPPSPARSISKSIPPSVIVRVVPLKVEAVIFSLVTSPSTSAVKKPLFDTNASTAVSSKVVSIVERSIVPLKPPPDPVKSKSVPLSSTKEITPSEPAPARLLKSTLPPGAVAELVKDRMLVVVLNAMSVSSLVSSPSPSLYRAPPSVPAIIEFGVSPLTIVCAEPPTWASTYACVAAS